MPASDLKDATFDYIIVGAGSAGCVLANKLSSNSNVSVLLIEGGPTNAGVMFATIPALFSKLFHTENDWDFYTEPQEALGGRRLYFPRGKLLGGSSSMNAMMVTEGAKSDYDSWGMKGWSYADIKPAMQALEGHVPRDGTVANAARGLVGLRTTGWSHMSPICQAYLKACAANGVEYNPDVNTGENALGGTEVMTFIGKGHRSSSATAFLTEEVLKRPNLTVLTGTLVLRVLFSKGSGKPRATGVEVGSAPGESYVINAKKEILLCAGAINTPKLLLLSGIGPKAHLDKVGVPVVVDSPWVGRNLLDHMAAGSVTWKAKEGRTIDWTLAQPGGLEAAQVEWATKGTGVLSSNVAETTMFFRTTDIAKHPAIVPKNGSLIPVKDNTSGPGAPDMEVIGAPVSFLKHGAIPLSNAFTMFPILLASSSTGFIELRSKDPWQAPIIDPKALSHPNDMAILIRALRLCLNIARTEPLLSELDIENWDKDKKDVYTLDPNEPDVKLENWDEYKKGVYRLGATAPELVTDEELRQHIVQNAETNYHPAGTAKMGNSIDTGVIDADLHVYGVEGLRVCDASMFPTLPAGHPDISVSGMALLVAQRMEAAGL